MLLGMSPPTPKERRKGYRQVATPKQAKLKASPPAQPGRSSAPSARRRSQGAAAASPGAPVQIGDLARKMGMMGASPTNTTSHNCRKAAAKPTPSHSSAAAHVDARRKPSLQRGKGPVLVPAHNSVPQSGVKLSPPVSEMDSQSDSNSTSDEREQPSPLDSHGKGCPREQSLTGPHSSKGVAVRGTNRHGGRSRVNQVVNEGRNLAAAATAAVATATATATTAEAVAVPSASSATQAAHIVVDLPHVDAAHPLEQAWARQTNSRYDNLRSLKLDHDINHAPAVDWAADAVITSAWQHLGGRHEHTARVEFCSEMLAPHGADRGPVSRSPGLVQLLKSDVAADALHTAFLTTDAIEGLLAGPRGRMQKLHSSITRMSYRALYPRTGPALVAEQEARRMDKAMATLQLLWPRSAARQTLLRKRQERVDGTPSPCTLSPRAEVLHGDPDTESSSPPAPDLWEPEKRSTIETLKDRKQRRLLKARAAGELAKAEAAKHGITFKRPNEAHMKRVAQEAAEQRQASKHINNKSQKVAQSHNPPDHDKCWDPMQGHACAMVCRQYEGASAGESPLAAAKRGLLARADPALRNSAKVEICARCGLAGSQLGHVDSAGKWHCQHCNMQSLARPSESMISRRTSTENFSRPSNIEHQDLSRGHKRRPLVRRRPQSATLQRSGSSLAGVDAPFTPPRRQRPYHGAEADADKTVGAEMQQFQSSSQVATTKDDCDWTRWRVGMHGIGGSPKTASELGFESRMRMMQMLGGGSATEEECSAQQAQAAALATTLMHRGATRADAELSAARTVQSTSQSMKKHVRMRMRPKSATAMPAAVRSHATPSACRTSHEAELEAVMLATVGALTVERGRIAEQLAWANKTGSTAGALLAERMHTAELAVEAATRVLAKPRSNRSTAEAQEAGGAMIEAAQALRQQVASCRDEQLVAATR